MDSLTFTGFTGALRVVINTFPALLISFMAQTARADIDFDGDGVADAITYNCTADGCTLTMHRSSDGGVYKLKTPAPGSSAALTPSTARSLTERTSIDPATGNVSIALDNGAVLTSYPKLTSMLSDSLSPQVLALSGFPTLAGPPRWEYRFEKAPETFRTTRVRV